MPTQSRGFFSCDYCGLSHDTFEEAKEHEVSQCPQRPPSNRSQPPAGPPHYYRGPPPPYGAGMGPLSGAEAEGYPPPYGHMPPHHDHPPYPPFKMRCMPLMGPHDRANLSMEDSIACQNIELFEATPEHVADHDPSRSGGTPVIVKQVGLRCVHCSKSPLSSAGYSTVFPGSLGSIAASTRMVADNHLSTCSMAPPEIREACDRAANKRSREGENEGRNADEEEEGSRLALLDYCVGFCQQLGIVNKQPHKTGIEFADSGEMGHHYAGHPAETPNGPRGPPPHPYSAERMGPPPMSAERMGYPGGPPGHRPGGMMGGPMGPGEGIAPTPLQRRRDRPGEGERPPYSAEREGGPPSGGYPTPYSQGGPPGSEHYPGQDGGGVQTPQQPNFEGQEGQAYPTPHSANEGGSPGYQQFDLPSNFPFYLESNRTWHCKFCSHVHPQYRDPQSVWSSPAGTPPPGNFIDQHLSMCRAYHQSMPSPPMYQGPPPPYGPPFMGQHMHPYGPPGPWEGHSPTHAGLHPQHYPPQYPGGPGEPPFPYPPHHPDHPRYPGAEDPYGDPRARPGGHPMLPPGMPGPHGPPGMPPHAALTPGGIPGRPGPASGAPARKENMADSMRHAINLLVAREGEYYAREPSAAKLSRLVLDEDRLLLTEYFFFLMKQLRLCRFSESDRKTRGGKREKIKIGYGGLQCIHCADVPNSRKFFWSNVDRLANSFAEIPGHVLKCRRCPQQTKDALLQLKQYHPEQMARLPRGSQKVFFRRMWRRLHDEDPEGPPVTTPTAEKSDAENVAPEEVEKTKGDKSPSAKMNNEESPAVVKSTDEGALVVQRSAKEAAKALAVAAEQNQPLTPSSRVVLAIPEDKEWLSDMDCFIRKQLEVFCADQDDVSTAQNDRKYPVFVGQVGIRCIHCSMAKGATGTAVAFPYAISQIYESVREFQRLHLDSCENLPATTKAKLAAFKGSSSLSSVLRKYYVIAAKALGLHDTREGIHPGGESIPLGSQAAFSFSDGASHAGEEAKFASEVRPAVKNEALSPAAEKKTEEAPAEKETEEAKSEEKTEEASAEKETEEANSEEKTEAASAEKETEEVNSEEKTEEAPAEKETEEAKSEEKTEEASAEKETEEAKSEEKTEEAPVEKETEEAKSEEKNEEAAEMETEEGKSEEKTEEASAEKETEEAKSEEKIEESPAEKETEDREMEKSTDKVTEEAPNGKELEEQPAGKAAKEADPEKTTGETEEDKTEAPAESSKSTDESSKKESTPSEEEPAENSKKRSDATTPEGDRPAKVARTGTSGDEKEV
jgi:hypothetical protein